MHLLTSRGVRMQEGFSIGNAAVTPFTVDVSSEVESWFPAAWAFNSRGER